MFHFKEFSIDDSKAAMKIGTDAVLLGAWAPFENESRILDIGTGSGILALMMAQRCSEISIDAVELDPEAAMLAKQNALLSPWPDRIHVFQDSFQEFSSTTMHSYSLIVCNPPFFSNSLKAKGEARNLARHNDTMPVSELLQNISKLLTDNGKAVFIIPADSYTHWKGEAAKYNLYPVKITFLKSSIIHKAHRVLISFSRIQHSPIMENELIIYTSKSQYTNEYKKLTDQFYLNF